MYKRQDEEIHRISRIDPWFLAKLRRIIEAEARLIKGKSLDQLDADSLFEAKQLGFSDRQIAWHTSSDELSVRQRRHQLEVRAVFKTVDTCAAEFASSTPYHYSTYERPLQTLQPDGSGCRVCNGRSYVCLLYTSPSPRDAHESRMPSSA